MYIKYNYNYKLLTKHEVKIVGGAVASRLVCSTPDRVVPGSRPGWGHCVVFMGKTLHSHSASLHPGV